MSDCLFCKIIEKEIPSTIHYEDDNYLVFEDINPKAPLHLLMIPKTHIVSINDLDDSNFKIMADITKIAKEIAKKEKLTGYRLVTNSGKDAGQIVFHLHVHLMGYK